MWAGCANILDKYEHKNGYNFATYPQGFPNPKCVHKTGKFYPPFRARIIHIEQPVFRK